MTKKFYRYHNAVRVIALSVAIVISMFLIARAESHTFDFEPAGGIELEHMSERDRERQGRESCERVQRGDADERDRERARDYEFEHMV